MFIDLQRKIYHSDSLSHSHIWFRYTGFVGRGVTLFLVMMVLFHMKTGYVVKGALCLGTETGKQVYGYYGNILHGHCDLLNQKIINKDHLEWSLSNPSWNLFYSSQEEIIWIFFSLLGNLLQNKYYKRRDGKASWIYSHNSTTKHKILPSEIEYNSYSTFSHWNFIKSLPCA